MNKQEVLSLGVKEENYRAFQAFYSRDVNRVAAMYSREPSKEERTRAAAVSMLKLIRKPETLERILKYINKAYFDEV